MLQFGLEGPKVVYGIFSVGSPQSFFEVYRTIVSGAEVLERCNDDRQCNRLRKANHRLQASPCWECPERLALKEALHLLE